MLRPNIETEDPNLRGAERGSGRYKAVSGPRGVRARALQRLRLTPEDSSAQQPTGTGDSQAGASKMGVGETSKMPCV